MGGRAFRAELANSRADPTRGQLMVYPAAAVVALHADLRRELFWVRTLYVLVVKDGVASAR